MNNWLFKVQLYDLQTTSAISWREIGIIALRILIDGFVLLGASCLGTTGHPPLHTYWYQMYLYSLSYIS